MAITLEQAKLLTNDKLAAGVIDEFRKDMLLDILPFDNTAGYNGVSSLTYSYNRVNTMRGANFRGVNAEYTAAEATTELHSVNLKPFGGTFQVDRVVAEYVKGATDQVTFQLGEVIKGAKALFSDAFINGDSSHNPLEFDGIAKAVNGTSTDVKLEKPLDLTTSAKIDANWKEFLDNLRRVVAKLDGKPTAMLMSREMYSVFQSIADRAQSFSLVKTNFGEEVLSWNGIPLIELGDKPGTSTPIIGKDEGNTTAIYFIRAGIDGVHGVLPEGNEVVKTWLPDFNDYKAVQGGGCEMVAAIAVKSSKAVGRLSNILI